MDLAKLDNNIPIKAIPEQELNKIVLLQLMPWLSKLLTLTDETSADRLEIALPVIKTHCWSMGFSEIKNMFELYADGKLGIEPIPNYFDRILLGKIFKAYKMHQRQNQRPANDYDQEKENKDFLYCVTAFDYFKQNGALPEQSVWLYDYLVDHKRILSVPNKEKLTSYNIALEKYKTKDTAILKSKLWLVEKYFDGLIVRDKHIKDEL